MALLAVALAVAQTSFPPIDEVHAPPALVRSVVMVPDPPDLRSKSSLLAR